MLTVKNISPDIQNRLAEYNDRLDRGLLAENTKRAIKQDLKAFYQWSQGNTPFPVSKKITINWIKQMQSEGKKYATIKRRLSSLAKIHKITNQPNPLENQDVIEELKITERSIGIKQKQVQPITESDFQRIIGATEQCSKRDMNYHKRNLAALAIMRGAMLRASEALALKWEDISFEDEIAIIHIRQSKTDQAGEGKKIAIPEGTTKIVKEWQKMLSPMLFGEGTINLCKDIKETPVIRQTRNNVIGKKALSYVGLLNAIKSMAKRAGMNSENIGTHSPRIGMAQDMEALGAGITALQKQGRWKNPSMPIRYTEKGDAKKSLKWMPNI